MRNLIVLAVAIVASTSLAFASELRGTIDAIDAQAKTLTVAGKVFQMPENWTNPGLALNDHVTVVYEERNGQAFGTSIKTGVAQ